MHQILFTYSHTTVSHPLQKNNEKKWGGGQIHLSGCVFLFKNILFNFKTKNGNNRVEPNHTCAQ